MTQDKSEDGKERRLSPNIDRSSPVPMYYQIAFDLRQRISRGDWKLNDRLPPEYELAELYDVTRTTIRQALAQLESEGILSRQRGSGTFITHLPDRLVLALSFPYSFTAQVKKTGGNPSSRIIQAEAGPVRSSETASYLGIEEGEEVAVFTRVFMANGQAVALSRSTIPHKLCPGITTQPLIDNSLSETFSRRYNLVPARAELWIDSVRALEEDAGLLGIDPGAPVLLITTLTLLENSTPLEYAVTYNNGNQIRLHSHITMKDEVAAAQIGIEADKRSY